MENIKLTKTDVGMIAKEVDTFIIQADTMLEDLKFLLTSSKKRAIKLQELKNCEEVLKHCHALSFKCPGNKLIETAVETCDNLTSNAFIGEVYDKIDEMIAKGETVAKKQTLNTIAYTYAKCLCYIEDRLTAIIELVDKQDLSDLSKEDLETLEDSKESLSILVDNISSAEDANIRLLKEITYSAFSGKLVVEDDEVADQLDLIGVTEYQKLLDQEVGSDNDNSEESDELGFSCFEEA